MSTMQVGKRMEGIKRQSFEGLGICKERYLQLKAGCETGCKGCGCCRSSGRIPQEEPRGMACHNATGRLD